MILAEQNPRSVALLRLNELKITMAVDHANLISIFTALHYVYLCIYLYK